MLAAGRRFATLGPRTAELSASSVKVAQTVPKPTKVGLDATQVGPSLAKLCPRFAKWGPRSVNCGRPRPPNHSPKIGRTNASTGGISPKLDENAQELAEVARNWSMGGQTRQNSWENGRTRTRIGQQNRGEIVPEFANLNQKERPRPWTQRRPTTMDDDRRPMTNDRRWTTLTTTTTADDKP